MPVTYNATDGTTTAQGNGAGKPSSVNHPVSGSDRLLIVTIGMDIKNRSGAGIASMTYSSVSLTKLSEQNDAANKSRCEIWYLIAPATGTNALAITYTGTEPVNAVFGIWTENGADQTSPFGTVVKGFDDGTGSSDTITVPTNGMGIGVCHARTSADSVTQNRDSRFNLSETGGGGFSRCAGQSTTVTGSVAMNYTWGVSTVELTHISAPISEATAGGALMAATITCAATAASTVTTTITFAATVAANSVVAAALTTSILIGSAVNASASPSALLTTDIMLDAAISATAAQTSDLTTGAVDLFDASVTASALTSSALTTSISLDSALSGTATTAGDLTVGVKLDSAVTGSAAAAASLTTTIPLAASATASVNVSTQLLTVISLDSSVTGGSVAASSLFTEIKMAASTSAAATVSGNIDLKKLFNIVKRTTRFQTADAKSATFTVTQSHSALFTPIGKKEVWF